jgi:6-phosphogluconolactonase
VPGSPDTLLVASAGWPSTSSAGAVLTLPIEATNGEVGAVSGEIAVAGPSYLAFAPDRRHVYAACRFPPDDGVNRSKLGELAAISLGPEAELGLVNRTPSAGHSPCHLTVDSGGCHVLVADYQDGLITVHPTGEQGAAGEYSSVTVRRGSGRDAVRQRSPHVHMVREHSPGGQILVTDLGTDEIAAYVLDHQSGELSPVMRSARVGPGSGPRHFAMLWPDLLLVATELRGGVTTVVLDPASGSLRARDVFACTEHDDAAPSAIVLSPDARHVYVGNRGPDTIGVLRIEATGLRLIDEVPSGGQPRDLAFAGERLYVANQESDTLAVLPYDPTTGGLGAPLQVIELPSPTCLLPYRRMSGYAK